MKKILVAAAVMACFGTAGAAEDITVDVAVIGAGGAGLSAAVQAVQALHHLFIHRSIGSDQRNHRYRAEQNDQHRDHG